MEGTAEPAGGPASSTVRREGGRGSQWAEGEGTSGWVWQSLLEPLQVLEQESI